MLIKTHLAKLVSRAVASAQAAGTLPTFDLPLIPIERAAKPEYGDYATSLALKLAREAKRVPLQIAQVIAENFPRDETIAQVQAAPPGFVNISLSDAWLARQVETILAQGGAFGNIQAPRAERIQIEFVSANPTGPLHIGSGRNAAIGDTLANLLQAAGHTVQREYYVNDAGSQVRHFGESLFARYAQALGRDESFPEDGYKGEYVQEMGHDLAKEFGKTYLELPRADAIRELGRLGIQSVLKGVRASLTRIGVQFDEWFSERQLYSSGLFEQAIARLKENNLVYQKEGATWFAAQEFGVERDAVLIRSANVIPTPEERPTYLASDVAYLFSKIEHRGFDRAIYVWGANQSNVPYMAPLARALGYDPVCVTLVLYQLVNLKRGGQLVHMSKRAGEFVTLDELTDEVGADAVRFMLISQSASTTMDFDLDLAKKHSDENPVYYVQYAHARIASILKKAEEQASSANGGDLLLLKHPAELDLIRSMLRLPEVVETAAQSFEPHHLPHYAIELAGIFHSFYKQCRVVSSDPSDAALMGARLRLVAAAKIVLARALDLMGVRAPESM